MSDRARRRSQPNTSHRHAPDPPRRRRQGHRPRAATAPTSTLPGMLHGASCAARTPTPASSRSTRAKAVALPGVKAVVTARRLSRAADRRASTAARRRSTSRDLGAQRAWRATRCSTTATPSPPSPRPAPHIAEEALDADRGRVRGAAARPRRREAMRDGRAAPARRPASPTGVEPARRRQAVQHRQAHRSSSAATSPGGFAEADVVVERELHDASRSTRATSSRTPRRALWNADGQLHGLDPARRARSPSARSCAGMLSMPIVADHGHPDWRSAAASAARPRSTSSRVAALLSQKTGRPVKMTMTRDEVFEATGPTPGALRSASRSAPRRDGTHRRRRGRTSPTRPAPSPARRSAPACMCVFALLRHPERPHRRLRRRRQQAEGRRLPRARRADAGVRRRDRDRRARGEARHRPARAAAQERRRRGRRSAPTAPTFGAHRQRRDAGGGARTTRTTRRRCRAEPRPRRRAAASGSTSALNSSAARQRQRRRHASTLVAGTPDIGGTRASLAMQLAETLGIAVRATCAPTVVDTDVGRLHRRHRRQPRHLRHRHGRRSRRRRTSSRAADRARRADLGVSTPTTSTGEDGVPIRRPDAGRAEPLTLQASSPAKLGTHRRPDHRPRVSVNAHGAGPASRRTSCDVEVDPETGKVDDPALHRGPGRRHGDPSRATSRARSRAASRRASAGR